MIAYEIMEEKLSNPEIGSYISYGILAYEKTAHKAIWSISDVFVDRKKADKYIQLFNDMELDIIHLLNVVDDLLQYA